MLLRVGLIDVDAEARGKITFPNLALMKLSAWHKRNGDNVSWYDPDADEEYDIVYMSKVFGDEYTKDYPHPVKAKKIVKGGSGYAITVQDGVETFGSDSQLPDEVEHIMPDYSIYEIAKNTAYGYLTRGCPRGCAFCHVKAKEGSVTRTVARLSEFWNGQKNIVLLDPNLTASRDYEMHMTDLAESRAYVDFSQGLDVRLLTAEKIHLLNRVRYKRIHFAWDNPDEDLRPHFQRLKEHLTKCEHHKVSAYVLTNYGSTHEQDLMRINFLREMDIQPYVMIYRKQTAPKETRQLQRWCNPIIFWKIKDFKDYHR